MSLLVVIPYCNKDVELARNLLTWIDDLNHLPDRVILSDGEKYVPNSFGSLKEFCCLLAADASVPNETRLAMKAKASEIFWNVNAIQIRSTEDQSGWPKGPNLMFHEVSRQIQECYKFPFLWLEPDAVPMRSDWLFLIAAEYETQSKRFMGTLATVTLNGQPPSRHMAGVGVYPNNAYERMAQFCAGNDAFDFAASAYTAPRMHETKLIHQIWGNHEQSPTFATVKTPESPPNTVVLDAIPKEAVLFHRCKDGSLVKLLREKMAAHGTPTEKVVDDSPPTPPYDPDSQFYKEPKRRGRPPKVHIGLPESKMANI